MPGEYRRKANLTMNTLEQTAAQWAADTRIHDVNVVLVPTDGADQGKHKMADGLKTYAELSFVEDSSTPSSGTIQITPFLYLSAGEGQGIYQYQFQNEGKPCYVLVGATASPENLANCVVWADDGSGLKWNVTDADVEVLYTSDSDVATPDLATGWTAEAGVDAPTPSIFLVAGPTVQDALEQLANKAQSVAMNDGAPMSGIYSYGASVGLDGTAVIDLTAATPALSSAFYINAYGGEGQVLTPTLTGPSVGAFSVRFTDQAGDPAYESMGVNIVVMGVLA